MTADNKREKPPEVPESQIPGWVRAMLESPQGKTLPSVEEQARSRPFIQRALTFLRGGVKKEEGKVES